MQRTFLSLHRGRQGECHGLEIGSGKKTRVYWSLMNSSSGEKVMFAYLGDANEYCLLLN